MLLDVGEEIAMLVARSPGVRTSSVETSIAASADEGVAFDDLTEDVAGITRDLDGVLWLTSGLCHGNGHEGRVGGSPRRGHHQRWLDSDLPGLGF